MSAENLPLPDDDFLSQPWSCALEARFQAAWMDPEPVRFWFEDGETIARPDLREGVMSMRRDFLEWLRQAETEHGPPVMREMLRRLEFEAKHDPEMPPWIHRPWFVPGAVMLRLECLLSAALGFGYSLSGWGCAGEYALRHRDRPEPLRVLACPVPGILPQGRSEREAIEERLSEQMVEIGLAPSSRLTLWNDTEPAKAFHGLMSGRIIREGYKALGQAPEPTPLNVLDGW
jgi:hypothetical protein